MRVKLAAGLVASALLLGGQAFGQSIGIELQATGDSTGLNGPTTIYDENLDRAGYREFQITITDAAEFALRLSSVVTNFIGAGPASNVAVMWLMGEDAPDLSTLTLNEVLADPDYVGAFPGIAGGTYLEGLVEDDTRYRLMVGSQYCLSCDMDYDIVFELFGAMLGWGPDVVAQLNEVGALFTQAGLSALTQSRTNLKNAVQTSFVSRDTSVEDVANGKVSQMMGSSFVWLRFSNYRFEEGSRNFQSPMIQAGADWALNNNLVAGVSVARADLTAGSADFSFDGDQVLVQPYLGWRQGDWRGTAALSLGRINYGTITHLMGTASAEGKLIAFNADLERDFDIGKGVILTPQFAIAKGRVELETTGGSLAGSGVGDTVDFSRGSLGAKLSQSTGNGVISVGLSMDYTKTDAETALYSGSFDQNGWSGTASVDYTLTLGNGLTIEAGASLGGLTRSYDEYSARLEISKSF